MLLPLFKGLDIKPNLRHLVLRQALLEAHRHGDTVHVVRGTRIKEVSENQLKDEVELLNQSGIDDEAQVRAQLKQIKRKYGSGRTPDRTHLLKDIIDSLQMLVTTEESDLSSPTPDPSYLFQVKPEKVEKLPAGAKNLPSWAPPGARNLRGMCEVNSCHYSGLVCV